MEQFIGTKLVNAKPMSRVDYNLFRGWDLPADENGADEGFLVEYVDGGKANTPFYECYVSWSPKDVFERAYKSAAKFDFGEAVRRLKAGKLVAREGWNGKGMFLLLVPGSTFAVSRAPLLGIFPEGTEINYLPHIDMRTATGEIVPWLASQSDVLCEDWVEVQAGTQVESDRKYGYDDILKYDFTRDQLRQTTTYVVFFKDKTHVELTGEFMTPDAMLYAALAKVNAKP